LEYIDEHPCANRHHLMSDIADGLKYLHSHGIIHGDLKGTSVLVDDKGRACLTDFSLSAVFTDIGSGRSIKDGHAVRWAAPEILDEKMPVSEWSDVYSFSMVTIEAFTGKPPFHGIALATVAVGVLAGKRPPRPTHPDFTDKLWEITKRCWNQEPRDRPDISEVVLCLQNDNDLPCGRNDMHDDQATDATSLECVREEGSLSCLCRQPSRWTSASCVLRKLCRFAKLSPVPRFASGDRRVWSEKPTARGNRSSDASNHSRREQRSWFTGYHSFRRLQSDDKRIKTVDTVNGNIPISNGDNNHSVSLNMRRRV